MLADALEHYDRWMRRAAEADGRSWPDTQAEIARITQEGQEAKNPILKALLPGVLSSGRTSRDRRARLRLLRAAATYLGSERIPELDDPFGSKILHAESEGKLRLWSVGRNNQDDGGKGNWKDPASLDIVLEIRR